MKISGQSFTTRKLQRVSVFAVHMALLGSLSACTENPFLNMMESAKSDSQSSGDPAANSAAQTEDGSNSVSLSQEVSAGAATPAVDQDSAIPELGTATPVITQITQIAPNPLAVIPAPVTESVVETEKTTEVAVKEETTDTSTVNESDTSVSNETDTSTASEIETTVSNETDTSTAGETDTSVSNETDASMTAETTEATEAEETTAPQAKAETTEADDTGDDIDPAVTQPGVDSSDVFAETDETNDANTADARESKSDSATLFTSHTSPGFTGEVIDGSIHVTWNIDPDALGYNVYLEGKYITTVWDNNYVETDLFNQDYYYEIQAFDQTKTIYYYIATGLTVSVTSAGRTDPAKPKANPNLLQDYELIFADEFNGNSLDTTKWNTSFLWGDDLFINGEVQYYVDIKNKPDFGFNPFTFDGEHLTINSIKTPSELSAKAKGQPYLSGMITSYDALQFIYGYAETRAKVTFGRGYWPAFWLLNAYYGQGGDDPEIDIMEFIGHDQDVVYHTYHYYDADGKLRSTESHPTVGIDYTAEFHTFAVEWKPGVIIYFVDGIEVHRVVDSKVSQQSMYVIANTAMGGWWAGDPDESTPFPGEYIIDYIRVYQRTTPFDDVLLNDEMTDVPYADDIPGQAIPNHRPTPEQWPAGYPHLQQ